jgi:heme-degrading monooxygenase HmoA
MIVRIWRTRIDPRRAGDYRKFAQTKSLPMFRAQQGFAGVLFTAQGERRAVITLWRDMQAVASLDTSQSYKETVAEIELTGFLQGAGVVETFELEGGFLEERALASGASDVENDRGSRASGAAAIAALKDLELVNFDHPSEVRTFEKGRFELYRVGPTTIGRATYEPGWKWSQHVGPATGETSCQVEHVGLVMTGQAVAKMDDGREIVMRAGDFFYIPPGHDSWVVGDEPYISLHILGGESYAT